MTTVAWPKKQSVFFSADDWALTVVSQADPALVDRLERGEDPGRRERRGGSGRAEAVDRHLLGNFHYYHPGSDLNVNTLVFDIDRNMPVRSPASGQVLYAGRPSSDWQGVVVIRHTMPGLGDGTSPVYVDSRSAHLDQIFVSAGQWIKRGALIGTTGRNLTDNGLGDLSPGPFHLHFEICISDLVARDPGFWPLPEDLQTVLENWTDPQGWIEARRA